MGRLAQELKGIAGVSHRLSTENRMIVLSDLVYRLTKLARFCVVELEVVASFPRAAQI